MPCAKLCANAIVSTATHVSASPAASASSSGRARCPLASSPAAANGRVAAAVTRAAKAARPAEGPAWSAGPSRATLAPTDPTSAKIAGQQRLGSRRRPSTLLSETLTSSEQPRIICTASSEPDPSAAACNAKPPASSAAPPSHSGCRASSANSHGLPASSVEVRAACRCSTATPAPYSTADNAARSNVVIPLTLLTGRFVLDGPNLCLQGGVNPTIGRSGSEPRVRRPRPPPSTKPATFV